jgi:tetratricopeptide (TPR) repeat protein
MKNIFYIFAVTATIFITASCNKMLEVIPKSDVTDTSYYTTDDELFTGVIGCYNGLIKTVSNEWIFTELRSDNSWQRETGSSTRSNLDLNDIDMFRPSAYLDEIYSYWYATYQNIASCNTVLKHLDVAKTDENRNLYEGEVRFIRAYHYFNLVRLFGPVFLCDHNITPQEAKKLNRVSVEEVYDFIISDLLTAIDTTIDSKLPNAYVADQKGRATVWAAKGLLAKVYLTLGRYQEAKTILEDIVQNSGHTILPDFEDVFSTSNEMNSEIIFAIRHKAGGYGLGCSFSNSFAPYNSKGAVVGYGDGAGLNSPTFDLYRSYSNDDRRKAATVGIWLNTASVEYLYPKKLVIPVTSLNDSELDFPVLRFADILLMLAECENELGNPATALAYLDPIRTRAGLSLLTGSSQMEARLLIENERRFELAFENHRFFDLVRTGRLKEVVEKEIFEADWVEHYANYAIAQRPVSGAIIQAWQELLPVPGREIDANNEIVITQNFGY